MSSHHYITAIVTADKSEKGKIQLLFHSAFKIFIHVTITPHHHLHIITSTPSPPHYSPHHHLHTITSTPSPPHHSPTLSPPHPHFHIITSIPSLPHHHLHTITSTHHLHIITSIPSPPHHSPTLSPPHPHLHTITSTPSQRRKKRERNRMMMRRFLLKLLCTFGRAGMPATWDGFISPLG